MKCSALVLSFFLFAICTGLTKCASVLGIKKIKALTDSEIIFESQKFGIDSNDPVYKINIKDFKDHYKKTSSDTFHFYKDIVQPLQIKAYDKSLKPTLYLVNCYVGGLPKLKWNRLGTFDKFPPEQDLFFMPDSAREINQTIDYLIPLQKELPNKNDLSKNDISLFVYWATFMGRHSKELINLVKAYKSKFGQKKIMIYFINMDNLLASK